MFGSIDIKSSLGATKSMHFKDLDPRMVREHVNARQVFEGWLDTYHERQRQFTGSMGFEERSGKEYLYRRRGRATSKSLGPRSKETEAMLDAFQRGREENKSRLASMTNEMTKQSAIVRALGGGGMPQPAARILRKIAQNASHLGLRVVGTNSLYAYAEMAGVYLSADSLATDDIDILVDDRHELKIMGEDRAAIGFLHLLKEVDPTFKTIAKGQYRATNAQGFMIEFVRPEPHPVWKDMPGAAAKGDEDIAAVPIRGLQWLVNAPAADAYCIDERGFATPLRVPDPRVWAAHKFWISGKEDRDRAKAVRDKLQGQLALEIVAKKLPQYPLDEAFVAGLPRPLRDAVAEPIANLPQPDRGERLVPDW